MSSEQLVRKLAHWTRAYQFCGDVVSRKTEDNFVVEFQARTTKTRASSMVTRVGLIASEVLEGLNFIVGKELIGEPALERIGLATWRIFVKVDRDRRKKYLVAGA